MPILQDPDTRLRLKSKNIKKQNISSDIVNDIINKMTIELQKNKRRGCIICATDWLSG